MNFRGESMIKKQLGLALVFLLIFTIAVAVETEAEEVEPYFGVSFNSFDLKDVNEIATNYGSKELNYGNGYYGGLVFQFNERVTIGGELDYLESNWKTLIGDVHTNSLGVLGIVKYDIEADFMDLNLVWGLGCYMSEIETGIKYFDTGKETSIGFKGGLESEILLTSKSFLHIRGLYRNNKANFKNMDLDYSGFEFGTGITINF
jgi:hypothetical protein